MINVPAYIFSVTAAAILCALAQRLTGEKGTNAALLRLISGILMGLVMIHPIGRMAVPNLSQYVQTLNQQVSGIVTEGANHSREALCQSISAQTAAYIQDKATALGLDLEIEVELNDQELPVPIRVALKGSASPGARSALSEIIANDLGIGKEDQIWK